MKFLNFVFIFFNYFCVGSKIELTPHTSINDSLIWSEEFNYDGLPNTKIWNYELGLVRKGEKQYYTKDISNAFVKNGCLYIKAIKRNIRRRIGNKIDTIAFFTSASLITKGKASWKYGKFIIRAKLPKGLGAWPAIWFMGINHDLIDWPKCGEIDMMEFVGKDPDSLHSNLHYPFYDVTNYTYRISNNNGSFYYPNLLDEFHIYEMDWYDGYIEFFIDGICYHKILTGEIDVDGKNPFQMPFYMIINLALGGKWGGAVDVNSLPMSFVIDYIRVYK